MWLAGLWQVLRSFNIEKKFVQAIQALYENSSSAVLLNSQLGEFFKSTVGVRQGCLLSPILFNLFLEKIMQEILHDHHTSIFIGGKPITGAADDIDAIGGSNSELQDLTNRFVDRATASGMEVSTEKSKNMTISTNKTGKGSLLNRPSCHPPPTPPPSDDPVGHETELN